MTPLHRERFLKFVEVYFPDGIGRANYPKLAKVVSAFVTLELEGAPLTERPRTPPSAPPPARRVAHTPPRKAKKAFVWKPPEATMQAIRAFLVAADRPVTAREIAKVTGFDQTTVYRVLPLISARCIGKEQAPGFRPKARLWVLEAGAEATQ